MKAEDIFEYELSMIGDKNIRGFVLKCFSKLCPDYFWTVPCSTTGKYHPQISLGKGGLVRHVKLAVWWGLELMRAMPANLESIPTLKDEVIATLLLHDLIKNGEGLDSDGRPLDRSVTGTHGVTLAEKICDKMLNCNLDIHTNDRILDGIAGHMGIWTTDAAYRPYQPFANLIHLADYCASRKVDEMYAKLAFQPDTEDKENVK